MGEKEKLTKDTKVEINCTVISQQRYMISMLGTPGIGLIYIFIESMNY